MRRNPRRTISALQDGTPTSMTTSFPLFSFGANNRGHGKDSQRESTLNSVRRSVGLYRNYPLANAMLCGADTREKALRTSGKKQINHVRGTDGWFKSMLVIQVRALDKFMGPWILTTFNAFLASILHELADIDFSSETLKHWDTVYALVLKTSLAFLLVFRLNRVAVRFWETRTMWGNVTHNTRNLVGGLLSYGRHKPEYRDRAIRWSASFCVAAMHFIRSEHSIPTEELAGILSRDEIDKMQEANHAPLYAASMIRYNLGKLFDINPATSPAIAHNYAIQLNNLESLVQSMVAQVSGMERVRSTPLPIVYVTHLRTFLFLYIIFLPYVWVSEWGWFTVPMVAFTAYALFGIEGSSSECEIPFDRTRPNHLALDAYCLVILDGVQGLVVQDANLDMQSHVDDHGDDDSDGTTTIVFDV